MSEFENGQQQRSAPNRVGALDAWRPPCDPWTIVPNRIAELERQVANLEVLAGNLSVAVDRSDRELAAMTHAWDYEHRQLAAMTRERDELTHRYAQARERNAFLADQNAKLYREVQLLRALRQPAAFQNLDDPAPAPAPRVMPAQAYRQPRKQGWEGMR